MFGQCSEAGTRSLIKRRVRSTPPCPQRPPWHVAMTSRCALVIGLASLVCGFFSTMFLASRRASQWAAGGSGRTCVSMFLSIHPWSGRAEVLLRREHSREYKSATMFCSPGMCSTRKSNCWISNFQRRTLSEAPESFKYNRFRWSVRSKCELNVSQYILKLLERFVDREGFLLKRRPTQLCVVEGLAHEADR